MYIYIFILTHISLLLSILDDIEDDDAVAEDDVEPEPEKEYSSLKDMLNDGNDDDDYYGYDEDNY